MQQAKREDGSERTKKKIEGGEKRSSKQRRTRTADAANHGPCKSIFK
jgi:hypothetical protein